MSDEHDAHDAWDGDSTPPPDDGAGPGFAESEAAWEAERDADLRAARERDEWLDTL